MAFKTDQEVEIFEKHYVQLESLHAEVSQLSKKSPNDAVNLFKLGLINKIIASGNAILPKKYYPFDDFINFDTDSLPTNSDVVMVLAAYIYQFERFRSDNVAWSQSNYAWYYWVNGKLSGLPAKGRTSVGAKSK